MNQTERFSIAFLFKITIYSRQGQIYNFYQHLIQDTRTKKYPWDFENSFLEVCQRVKELRHEKFDELEDDDIEFFWKTKRDQKMYIDAFNQREGLQHDLTLMFTYNKDKKVFLHPGHGQIYVQAKQH